MSLLGDIFGGLLTVGGIAAAPFTGGATLGLAAAGAGVLAGSMAGDASQTAAQQQIAANNQALAQQQAQYANAQKLLSPFQYGGSALAGLNHPVTNQAGPGSLLSGYTQGINARNMALGGQSVGYGQPLGAQSSVGLVAPSSGSQMVAMVSPAGTTGMVPAAQVAHFQSLGATLAQ